MKEKQNIQYTVRDIPEELDARLRETAAMEEVSLNQSVLRALNRGLGLGGGTVRYRSLRKIVNSVPPPDRKGWSKLLQSMDTVNDADWK
jgi:hypothetical protein